MLEIQIAGAGAGKTYGLAQLVVDKQATNLSNKEIYALSFTNAAKNKIREEIEKKLAPFPRNIRVMTVHKFLLENIIFPYSNYILSEPINNASTQPINPEFKKYTFKALRKKSTIHVDEAYQFARKIVDKSHSFHSSKIKKKKVEKVINLLEASIESIYVDEVQDLDMDALKVFKALSNSKCHIYMIGDPKQAIKYPGKLADFITLNQSEKRTDFNLLPNNNYTRRVPEHILRHSNPFCPPGQKQKSLSTQTGNVFYFESTNINFSSFIAHHLAHNSIICIDKKNSKYSTQSSSNKYFFHSEILSFLESLNHNKDRKLFAYAQFDRFCTLLKANALADIAIKQFLSAFPTYWNLEKKKRKILFAQLHELATKVKSDAPAYYQISSIDKIKGLDSEYCLLVLTPNLFKYVARKSGIKRYNKEWNKVYVALTRAKKELIFIVDHDIILPELRSVVIALLRSRSIYEHPISKLPGLPDWYFDTKE